MIWRLGHVELTVDDLDRAEEFYVGLLGFDRHDRSDGRLYLRAAYEFDAWSLCLREDDGKGLGHLGFRVSDDASLDELEQSHRDAGLPVERVAAGAEPHQGEAVRTVTPDGHPIEFYHRFDEIQVPEDPDVRLPMRRTNERRGSRPSVWITSTCASPTRLPRLSTGRDRWGSHRRRCGWNPTGGRERRGSDEARGPMTSRWGAATPRCTTWPTRSLTSRRCCAPRI